MFIKRSSPKYGQVEIIEKTGISDGSIKCSKCGKSFQPHCENGVCETICPECKIDKNK